MEYATCHLYTHEPLGECVYEENTSDKWHVPRYPTQKHCITTLSHAQIFGKLMEIFGRARKPQFKSVFQMFLWFFKIFGKSSENFGSGSKVTFRCFYDFLKFLENLRKYSEIFGNGSKVIFRCFKDFLKFSENLPKSTEVFGNLRKRFPDVIGNVCNSSQELKGFGAHFWEVHKWTPVNCCAQGMTRK